MEGFGSPLQALPVAQTGRLIEFETAEVISQMIYPPRTPDYWGIEVIGANRTEQIPMATEDSTRFIGFVNDGRFRRMFPPWIHDPYLAVDHRRRQGQDATRDGRDRPRSLRRLRPEGAWPLPRWLDLLGHGGGGGTGLDPVHRHPARIP
jgi:hypothetical protein